MPVGEIGDIGEVIVILRPVRAEAAFILSAKRGMTWIGGGLNSLAGISTCSMSSASLWLLPDDVCMTIKSSIITN